MQAKVAPKSSRGAFDLFGLLRCVVFVKIVEKNHGALVGLTNVKGTNVDKFSLLIEKK